MSDLARIVTENGDLIRILIISLFGFLLSIGLTPLCTSVLYKYKFWKQAKEETLYGSYATVFQKLHGEKHKRNIPTMAGILVWGTILIITLLFNLTRNQTYLPLFFMVAVGILGAIDDWFNIRGIGGVKGVRARHKFMWLFAIAAFGAWWFFAKLGMASIHIPAYGDIMMGWWYVPVFMFVILATTNAVNISDGLDGLSGGLLATAFTAYGVLAFLNGQISLAIFCGTAAGALVAYLWFNVYPARFFGGDTYALSMGATLGVVAMLIKSNVGMAVLPLIAFVPMVETLSVILQLGYRKLFHKKLFLIAPLHHHFEALGWPETKVTMRLWIIGAFMALLGVIVGIIGGGAN
ncbi:TPA: phospho-N-acetylmuramoyl-pentapeptide-transferase [Patescibacteria group bacterium]|uniref:Phospho-N-acetylmuramoyl-pentapeptide-transferase n=1 Tax=candidate division Kazan bacterium GW2011_GWA1_44_22 TaxID=1620410 RepID=A0A0G1I1J2_UNCK3|nr:MAG: Phospho-N-acetylmuramoyl-pentapeptide-transferase [candidate division Kazan bacterium GW2011_GWA1_44_22]HAR54783.1 phospho-N-acetylmuramoyl-pentapeptide-transferase [Patescibacteria group bacterium]HCR42050.1 phospho-N-acetylmuramoyl-pentapeptide-transferase [Patescibacteria group bacterium]